MRTGSVRAWGALGACAVVVAACGSSRPGHPTGGGGSAGSSSNGAASAAGGEGDTAGTLNAGGTFGHAGTLATGGVSGDTHGGTAGEPAGGAAEQGGQDGQTGGAGGEGGTPDPGPQPPVTRITMRSQSGEYETSPSPAVMQPDITESRGLWLQSSHLIVDEKSGAPNTWYDWYGEVKNFGSEVVCTPLVNIEFFADVGQQLQRYSVAGTVRPKLMLETLTKGNIRCLGPGESAVAIAHAVAQGNDNTKVQDTALEVVSWQSESTTEVEPDPKAPTLEQVTVIGNAENGYYAHGVANIGSAALSSFAVFVYPRIEGVIGGGIVASTIGQELPAQSQKEFVTGPFAKQFTTFLTSVEYFEP